MKPISQTTSVTYLQEARCLLQAGDVWAATQLAIAIVPTARDLDAAALYKAICEQLRLDLIQTRCR